MLHLNEEFFILAFPVSILITMLLCLAINRFSNFAGGQIAVFFDGYAKLCQQKGVKLSILYRPGLYEDNSDYIFSFEKEGKLKECGPVRALWYLNKLQC